MIIYLLIFSVLYLIIVFNSVLFRHKSILNTSKANQFFGNLRVKWFLKILTCVVYKLLFNFLILYTSVSCFSAHYITLIPCLGTPKSLLNTALTECQSHGHTVANITSPFSWDWNCIVRNTLLSKYLMKPVRFKYYFLTMPHAEKNQLLSNATNLPHL